MLAACGSSDFDMRGEALTLSQKELACDSVILESQGQIQNTDGSFEERFFASGCGKANQYRCKKSRASSRSGGYTGFCCNINDAGCLFR